MWFRNLIVYRLGAGWARKVEDLDAKLAQQPLQKCGGFEMESRGWLCPRYEGQYVYDQNRQWLLALGLEQKLLPTSVIRDTAAERVAELEGQLGRALGRKQKREIADRVTAELLPRAFSRRRRTYAWIDRTGAWLAVDAAGAPKAEQFMEALRKAEEDLPAVRLETQTSPSASMSRWIVQGEAPGAFSIDEDLELLAQDGTKATVRYSRHGLQGQDIRDHIAAGKQPVRLGLTWNDRVSFVLSAELELKRLAFPGLLERESGEEIEDEDERFEATFALMTGELSRLLVDLVAALGGEKPAEGRTPAERLEASTV